MSHAQQTLNPPPVANRTPMALAVAEPERPPYWMAAAVVLGALVIYVLTLAPTTQFWDTSEYIAASYTLGIPHPPGNPFFVLVAHVWGLIPWAAGYAERINLFAAATSAVSAGCWFLIGERWLRRVVPTVWPRRLAALAGALVAATSFTVWNQSVVNEKVYTLSLLSIALILWLIVRWDDQPAGEAHDHYLLLIVYLLALTATNHMMGVLVGPVVMVLLFPPLKTQRGKTEEERAIEWSQFLLFTGVWSLLIALGLEGTSPIYAAAVLYVLALAFAVIYAGNWRFALALLGVAAVGLSVYIFLPIRAAHFPPINEGEPTNWEALWAVLTRQQYGKPPIFDNPMYPPGAGNPGHTLVLYGQQILNYFQYFSWQVGHDWPERVQRGLAVLFGGVGLLGAYRHWRADRRTAVAMTLLVFTFTFALIFYLNFKWGFSQPYSEPGLQHEVRERDYFFICSFAMWGIWVGMGLATLMETVQDWLRPRQPEARLRWAVATPVLALALVPLLGNRFTASRAGEAIARDFAVDLLQTVEPYGVLVTAGDNDTFPLWYAQEVEGVRRDVTVVNLSLANTDWYLRQMQRRPIATFDSTAAPAIYRGRAWPKPTRRVADHQGSTGQAANLLFAHGRHVRRPIRLDGSARGPGFRAGVARAGGAGVGYHQGGAVARLGQRQAHDGAVVRRVPRRERRPPAAARLGRSAVGRDPHDLRRALLRPGAGAADVAANPRGAGASDRGRGVPEHHDQLPAAPRAAVFAAAAVAAAALAGLGRRRGGGAAVALDDLRHHGGAGE